MFYYETNGHERLKRGELSSYSDPKAEMNLVKVYPDCLKQRISGFGGAFTEAAGYTFAQMEPQVQQEYLELMFGEAGNQYQFCRLHIQSCDFALGNYAYIESAEDKELSSFSVARDKEYIIPLVQEALKKNPDIEFLASPWSPPGFMKTNGMMNHGGKLKKEFYPMWADMIVRYIKEYRQLAIVITRLTVQNEPNAVQKWDSCLFDAGEEVDFACNYLRKALDREGLAEIKINIWDHNKDCILERAEESFKDDRSLGIIDGIAFHWYSGTHFDALRELHERYPDKELLFTEGCVEYSRFADNDQTENAQMYANEIIGNFNAGMNGFIDWNILLDEKGGPNHVGNYCDAPVMYDTQNHCLDIKLTYYYIAHFSRFIKAGARRMLVTSYTDQLVCSGFVNPDGGKVLVILNKTDRPYEFKLCEGQTVSPVRMEAHSIQTICWDPQ